MYSLSASFFIPFFTPSRRGPLLYCRCDIEEELKTIHLFLLSVW